MHTDVNRVNPFTFESALSRYGLFGPSRFGLNYFGAKILDPSPNSSIFRLAIK